MTIQLVKIGADGNELPIDATDHVLVKSPDPEVPGGFLLWDVAEYDKGDHDAALVHPEKLQIAGYTGFIVPSVLRLEIIRDLTTYDPAADKRFFPNIRSGAYWAKERAAWSAEDAWVVHFGSGYAGAINRDDPASFRAVRPCQ